MTVTCSSVGSARSEHRPDLSTRRARIGDRYLLCTDGLLVLNARSIHHVLSAVDDPQTAAEQLVDRANAAGGPDNIACVIVDMKASRSQ